MSTDEERAEVQGILHDLPANDRGFLGVNRPAANNMFLKLVMERNDLSRRVEHLEKRLEHWRKHGIRIAALCANLPPIQKVADDIFAELEHEEKLYE